jgi:hypothetical protein
VSELTGRGRARCNQALELFSFGFDEDNGNFFLQCTSTPSASMIKSIVTEHWLTSCRRQRPDRLKR